MLGSGRDWKPDTGALIGPDLFVLLMLSYVVMVCYFLISFYIWNLMISASSIGVVLFCENMLTDMLFLQCHDLPSNSRHFSNVSLFHPTQCPQVLEVKEETSPNEQRMKVRCEAAPNCA